MAAESVIRLAGVGVYYRTGLRAWRHPKRWVLQDLDLELRAGETLGVIGVNGAGKSTLTKILAGIIAPNAGSISFQCKRLMLLSLRVGFMTHLSGRENAYMSGLLLGMRRAELDAAMPFIAEYAELGAAFDDPVRTYSSGMRARLGFAVACHAQPDVLLIDEVMGVGDARFRKKSLETMRELIGSDRAVVMVSHQEEVLKQTCDRLVWLDGGRIRSCGDVDQVLDEYAAVHASMRRRSI